MFLIFFSILIFCALGLSSFSRLDKPPQGCQNMAVTLIDESLDHKLQEIFTKIDLPCNQHETFLVTRIIESSELVNPEHLKTVVVVLNQDGRVSENTAKNFARLVETFGKKLRLIIFARADKTVASGLKLKLPDSNEYITERIFGYKVNYYTKQIELTQSSQEILNDYKRVFLNNNVIYVGVEEKQETSAEKEILTSLPIAENLKLSPSWTVEQNLLSWQIGGIIVTVIILGLGVIWFKVNSVIWKYENWKKEQEKKIQAMESSYLNKIEDMTSQIKNLEQRCTQNESLASQFRKEESNETLPENQIGHKNKDRREIAHDQESTFQQIQKVETGSESSQNILNDHLEDLKLLSLKIKDTGACIEAITQRQRQQDEVLDGLKKSIMHSSGGGYSLSDIVNKLNELSSITFQLENSVNGLKTEMNASRTKDSTGQPKIDSHSNQDFTNPEIEKVEPISYQNT